VNRQGGSFVAPRPDRGARGWAAEAAYGDGYPQDVYGDGYPQDAQLLGPALDTGAYPVDPGYRGRTSDRPRPADLPPGPPRTRPERDMPPRPGFPPRPSRPTPRDQDPTNRPWPRPEDAAPFAAGDSTRAWGAPASHASRPRPRPSRGPAAERPRTQAAGRTRPTAEETIMSNGRRVPPNGPPTPPRSARSARPEGLYTDYDQTPGGPQADGRRRGQAGRAGRPGPAGQQYGPAREQYDQTAQAPWQGQGYGQPSAREWAGQGQDQDQYSGMGGQYGSGQPRADQYGPQQPGHAAAQPGQPGYAAEYSGAGPDGLRSNG